jgi:hypothetical protein
MFPKRGVYVIRLEDTCMRLSRPTAFSTLKLGYLVCKILAELREIILDCLPDGCSRAVVGCGAAVQTQFIEITHANHSRVDHKTAQPTGPQNPPRRLHVRTTDEQTTEPLMNTD